MEGVFFGSNQKVPKKSEKTEMWFWYFLSVTNCWWQLQMGFYGGCSHTKTVKQRPIRRRTCVVWLSLLSSVGQLVHKNIRSISKKCLPPSVSWVCTRSGNFSDALASLDLNHVSESLIVSNLYVIDQGSKEHQRRKKEGEDIAHRRQGLLINECQYIAIALKYDQI